MRIISEEVRCTPAFFVKMSGLFWPVLCLIHRKFRFRTVTSTVYHQNSIFGGLRICSNELTRHQVSEKLTFSSTDYYEVFYYRHYLVIVMTTVLLQFKIHLYGHYTGFHGPSFHNWLPNGIDDALWLDTKIPNTKLKVWFDRRGYVNNTLGKIIEFDNDRSEVDETVMKQQVKLDAGNLYGELRIDDVADKQLESLKQKKNSSNEYMNFGKIFQRAIYSPVALFLNLLKIRYGQYWIPNIEKWDSNKESIGDYCLQFNIRWSCNDGSTWEWFKLASETRLFGPPTTGSRDYNLLTKDDWSRIPTVLKNYQDESIAGETIAQSSKYLIDNELRHAIIDGVIALELTLTEFLTKKGQTKELKKKLAEFQQETSSTRQLILIGTLLGWSANKIQNILDVIYVRNGIVHEGIIPDEPFRVKLKEMLEALSILLGGPEFRFPNHNAWARLYSDAIWHELMFDYGEFEHEW